MLILGLRTRWEVEGSAVSKLLIHDLWSVPTTMCLSNFCMNRAWSGDTRDPFCISMRTVYLTATTASSESPHSGAQETGETLLGPQYDLKVRGWAVRNNQAFAGWKENNIEKRKNAKKRKRGRKSKSWIFMWVKKNDWRSKLLGVIESFPNDWPSLSWIVSVYTPSGIIPIVPLTCIIGVPKDLNSCKEFLMCASYFHYERRSDVAQKILPSGSVCGSALWSCQAHKTTSSMAHHFNSFVVKALCSFFLSLLLMSDKTQISQWLSPSSITWKCSWQT